MLSVILPCHNEAEGLPLLQQDLLSSLDALGPYELLAVDDGSTDGTPDLLRALAGLRPRARVLTHASRRGIGAALRTALAQAQGDWVVPLDADLSFHPRHIPALLAAQRLSGADCVCGSPFLPGAGMSGVPWTRRLASLAVNALYRALFARNLSAYTPMFRLYRTSALRAIAMQSAGFEASAEILVRLWKTGRLIVEVPVPLAPRRAGRSKLRGPGELADHLRLIARLRRESSGFPRIPENFP